VQQASTQDWTELEFTFNSRGISQPFVRCGSRNAACLRRRWTTSISRLVFDLATCAFIGRREDALFLGPGGTGKSHLARAIGQSAIQQGYRVLYRETHTLLDELADAVADASRKEFMESLATVPLLIIDDFGMRKLPLTAAEDLLEIVMRRYERASTLRSSCCWNWSRESAEVEAEAEREPLPPVSPLKAKGRASGKHPGRQELPAPVCPAWKKSFPARRTNVSASRAAKIR
jgi:hypothetical protein